MKYRSAKRRSARNGAAYISDHGRGIESVSRWLATLWVVAVLLLQGCAATGPKSTEMTAALNAVPGGYGRIVFYRVNSVMGAAVQPEIRLDG
jgi:hypothetical protein